MVNEGPTPNEMCIEQVSEKCSSVPMHLDVVKFEHLVLAQRLVPCLSERRQAPLIDDRVEEVHVVTEQIGQVDQRRLSLDRYPLVERLDLVGQACRLKHDDSPRMNRGSYAP